MPENKNDLLSDLNENWSYKSCENEKVACFANCERVVFKLNGIEIDELPTKDQNSGGICWTIPFLKGGLFVSGYINGKEVANFQLKSFEQPETIGCQSDVQALSGKGDTAQMKLTLLDKNGNPVFISDNEITCQISGPAKLLGLENGDMTGYGGPQNKLRVFYGRMLAFMESTDDKGQVSIEFSGNWLSTSKITLQINKHF